MNLSPRDIARVAAAVRDFERTPRNEGSHRGRGSPGLPPDYQLVRVTSTTTTAGRYPGKVLTYTESTNTFSDLADCWVRELNGGTLAVSRYPARRTAPVASTGVPVFVAQAGGGTFTGGTISGDTTVDGDLTINGNVLWKWAFVSWTGTQNNYALADGVAYLGVTLTGNATLTGIAGGVEGRALRIVLIDSGGFTLTIKESDTGSSAANRIQLQNLDEWVMGEQVQGVELVYASDSGGIDNWLLKDDRLQVDNDTSPVVGNVRRLRFEQDWFAVSEPSSGTAKVDPVFSGAEAYRTSGTQTLTSSTSAYNALTFNAASQTGATYWASGNPSRLTVPVTGRYAFGGSVHLIYTPDAFGSAEELVFRLALAAPTTFTASLGSATEHHVLQPGVAYGINLCVSGQSEITAGASGYLQLGVLFYNPLGGGSVAGEDASVSSGTVNFWIRRLS